MSIQHGREKPFVPWLQWRMTQTIEFQKSELITQCLSERAVLGVGSSAFSPCYQFLSNQSADFQPNMLLCAWSFNRSRLSLSLLLMLSSQRTTVSLINLHLLRSQSCLQSLVLKPSPWPCSKYLTCPAPHPVTSEHRRTGCSHKHHGNTHTWKDDWNGLISSSSFWILAFSPGYIVFPPVRKTFWTRIACCSFEYLWRTRTASAFLKDICPMNWNSCQERWSLVPGGVFHFEKFPSLS